MKRGTQGRPARRQGGMTLIELLVGLSIGLMTIAVALGALVVARGVSGTVSEASQMQQQAAYALRIIGQQLRQAGAIRLNLAFARDIDGGAGVVIDPADPVAFEDGFDRATGALGADNNFALRIGYQNYTDRVFGKTDPESLLRDCLGQQPSTTVIASNFAFVRASGAATGELQCVGNTGTAQTILSNVADFQVRYFLQNVSGAAPTIAYVTAAGVGTNWPAVVGVEVCFEIVGEEIIDTAGATYRNCSWQTGDAEASMGNRTRMVFRNAFQLRSQGVAR